MWLPQDDQSACRLDAMPRSGGFVIPDADFRPVYLDRDPPIVLNRDQGPAAVLQRVALPGQLGLDEVDLMTRRVEGAFRVIHTVESGSRGLVSHR